MSLADDIEKVIRTPKEVKRENKLIEKQRKLDEVTRNSDRLFASLLELISERAKHGDYKLRKTKKIFRGTMVCHDSISISDDSRDGYHCICDIWDLQPERVEYGRRYSFKFKFVIPKKFYDAFKMFKIQVSQKGIKVGSPYLVNLKNKKEKRQASQVSCEFKQSFSHPVCIQGSIGDRIEIAFDYYFIIT
jgi:hypothetical protein